MRRGNTMQLLLMHIIACFVTAALAMPCFGQCKNSACIYDKLIAVENSTAPVSEAKFKQVADLKKEFEAGGFTPDSVYARLLHRLGLYRYLLNGSIASNYVLTNTLYAVQINMAGNKSSCKSFAVRSYNNLGLFYQSLFLNDKALNYFDSALQLSKQFPDPGNFSLTIRLNRVLLLFKKADFQQAEEESSQGITAANKAGDSSFVLSFLNLRAASLLPRGQLQKAAADAGAAIAWARHTNDLYELTSAFETSAQIYGALNNAAMAKQYFLKAIATGIKKKSFDIVIADYIKFGNYCIDVLRDYTMAEGCYHNALAYAQQWDSTEGVALCETNIDVLYFLRGRYMQALQHNNLAINKLLHTTNSGIFTIPAAAQLNAVSNWQLLYTIFSNKTETLTYIFKQTKDTAYLNAALKTALLTDTILTNMRNAQTGEQSKLYWRDHSKMFYGYALAAAYLKNDAGLAFYFMEKSRSVLLGDALNELGASAHLLPKELGERERLQVNVIEGEQKLAKVKYGTPEFTQQEGLLLQAKDNLGHYIKMLEQQHPVYYQYKYAGNVPSLNDVQKYLAQNSQSFIYYFTNDTVAYVLAVLPSGTKFIKLGPKEFNDGDLAGFQQFCAGRQTINNNYPAFAKLSNKLYKTLFNPLQIPAGNVIICTGDFLIPFEALCTDTSGKNFLVSNYTFSYVYSASYLLRKFAEKQPAGNFFGVAPVYFTAYNNLPALISSDEALKASCRYYNNSKLYLTGDATRQNFFKQAPGYAVVTVFSHASADTADIEPVMYMADSTIRLSELAYFNNPATQLVILSACQTNVGKKATGEGIYSLARGFSAAGIPAVAATLWQANDKAIYTITGAFNQNLAMGMRKDEALKQAKLAYIKQGGSNILPYYWASMIVVGNVQPLQLSAANYTWQITGAVIILAACITAVLITLRQRKRLRTGSVSKHTAV